MVRRIVAVYDHKMDDLSHASLLQGTLDLASPGDSVVVSDQEWQDVVLPGDILVVLGNDAAKTVLGRKVSITKVIGDVERVGENQAVMQFSPAYVAKQQEFKGGSSEKAQRLWLDVWDQISQLAAGTSVSPPETWSITDTNEAIGLVQWLTHDFSGKVIYDYETWGDKNALRPDLNQDFRIVSIGVAWRQNGSIQAASFLFDRPGMADPELEIAWRDCMAEEGRGGHSVQYEHKCNLRRFGYTARLTDTQLKMHTLDELADGGLDRLMVRCGLYWHGYKRDFGTTRTDPMHAEVGTLLRYNALDAYATYEIDDALVDQLETEGLTHIARQNEGFAVHLAREEVSGMQINPAEVVCQRAKLAVQSEKLLKELRAHPEVQRVERWAKDNIKSFKSGKKKPVFNPRSTPMMQRLVINELGVKVPVTREKGKEKKKLDKKSLETFVDSYPVLRDLNAYRSCKAMEVFLSKWDTFVCARGRVHTQYNQTKVVTGRLSSTNPPLQNIPKDQEVRRVFVSRYPNGWLINADYAQQEPRLQAGWSGDPKMIKAILGGMNLHAFVGSEIHNVPYEQVIGNKDSKEYDIGKKMNLGLSYGLTEFGLSKKAKISIDRARQLLAVYAEMFPGLTKWRLSKHREAIEYGYVTDLFGARRHLPGAQSSDEWERGRALRQAGNYPIQATAYRFTQIAAGCATELLDENCYGEAEIVGQVHDSLIADSSNDALEETLSLIVESMRVHNDMPYWKDRGVPMDVDIKIGRNLFDMKPVKIEKIGA